MVKFCSFYCCRCRQRRLCCQDMIASIITGWLHCKLYQKLKKEKRKPHVEHEFELKSSAKQSILNVVQNE